MQAALFPVSHPTDIKRRQRVQRCSTPPHGQEKRMKRAFAGHPNPATTLPRQTGTVHTAYFLLLFSERSGCSRDVRSPAPAGNRQVERIAAYSSVVSTAHALPFGTLSVDKPYKYWYHARSRFPRHHRTLRCQLPLPRPSRAPLP